MKQYSTSERLHEIMILRNLKQVDILKLCEPICTQLSVKLNKNDLSQYVNGKVEPGQFKLTVLAKALNVSEAWLMGYDVPMTAPAQSSPLSPEVQEIAEQIEQLDTEDRAEIRGEVRGMLKADKYKKAAADTA